MFAGMTLKEMGKKDYWAVFLALLVSAAAWSVDNQATVMTWVAVGVVWVVNMLFQWRGIKLGRGTLSLFLFALAVGLAVLFEPVGLPAAPVYMGDAAQYAQALMDYLSALAGLGSGIVAAATLLYNALLRDVLNKLWYSPTIVG